MHLAGLTQYRSKISYCEKHFTGATLSNQTLLMLPVVFGTGRDAKPLFSVQQQIEILGKMRTDLHFPAPEAFNEKYSASHDTESLNGFYSALQKGAIIAAQTSDSVWKSIDASYMLFVRVGYAVKVKSFDGNSRRTVHLDVEIWSVASQEAVWRIGVTGFDRTGVMSDARFIQGALIEAFDKLPGYMPENNETNW
jgi:hypothetical protein